MSTINRFIAAAVIFASAKSPPIGCPLWLDAILSIAAIAFALWLTTPPKDNSYDSKAD